ncbi:MAG: hypothetical protein HFG49_14970 [Lachnospiraceae bacterium]|nr:hypothetical protein [Lachnospiraceae bacterium]
MMGNKEFTEKIAKMVESRLDSAEVHVHNVKKNNGVYFTGLSIREEGSNISPCIYLEGFYSGYENGDKNMEAIAGEIICLHRKNGVIHSFDVSLFTEYRRARPMLRGRLINTERNTELLKDAPHRKFFDLSLVYYVEIPHMDRQEVGSILVQDWHMQLWEITEQELYRQIMENMAETDQASILNMADIFADMHGFNPDSPPEKNIPIYILTNQRNWNGAVQILNRKALKDAAVLFGSDYYILPSSIHETILVPVGEQTGTAWELTQIVQEVNQTEVLPEEFLSSHVYRYCVDKGKLQIAA